MNLVKDPPSLSILVWKSKGSTESDEESKSEQSMAHIDPARICKGHSRRIRVFPVKIYILCSCVNNISSRKI
jgi:hypothetical protein